MRRIEILLPAWVAIILIGMMGVSSWSSPYAITPVQQVDPTSTPAMPPSTTNGWIILNLPAGASQLEVGAEIYRLVCKACHGDKGQGLTDEWRSTWAPDDQNCWKSKCHAANHPPDGFVLPVAPAVVGPNVTARFDTAVDLHDYISAKMPWQAPGSLTAEQYWQVTAYILKMNDIESGNNLNAGTASKIQLRPSQLSSPAKQTQVYQKSPSHTWALAIGLLALLFILALYLKRAICR